jgi:hypothetical protein
MRTHPQRRYDSMGQTRTVSMAPDETAPLQYGVVRIVRGRHRGQLGYYDDDEDGYALVYLGAPFASPLVRVRYTSLVPCDDEPFGPLDEWLLAYPGLATQLGVGR